MKVALEALGPLVFNVWTLAVALVDIRAPWYQVVRDAPS